MRDHIEYTNSEGVTIKFPVVSDRSEYTDIEGPLVGHACKENEVTVNYTGNDESLIMKISDSILVGHIRSG